LSPIRIRPPSTAEKLRSEWVVRIDGKVRMRPEGTENPDLPTG
jgi:aspartyl-tRNA synthetase